MPASPNSRPAAATALPAPDQLTRGPRGPRRSTWPSRCPACHESSLRRWPRDPGEQGLTEADELRRYRCVHKGCGFAGLVEEAVPSRRAGHGGDRSGWLAWSALLALSLLCASGAAALRYPLGVPWWQFKGWWMAQFSLGDDDPGQELPAAHPLRRLAPPSNAQGGQWIRSGGAGTADGVADRAVGEAPPLALRQGCVWGQPGRAPYQGTVEAALRTAGLPPEVIRQVAAQVKARSPVERLTLANDGIVGQRTGRRYEARDFALTYGRTLCLNARINFAKGHTEPADLYEARDEFGRIHSVMVPDVCGNVSVIHQPGAPWIRRVPAAKPRKAGQTAAAPAAHATAPQAEGLEIEPGAGLPRVQPQSVAAGGGEGAPDGTGRLPGAAPHVGGAGAGVAPAGAGPSIAAGLPAAVDRLGSHAAVTSPGRWVPAPSGDAGPRGAAEHLAPNAGQGPGLVALLDMAVGRDPKGEGVSAAGGTATGGPSAAGSHEVPEPGTIALGLLGLVGVGLLRRRRR